jgi:signal transduction histidine kinase
VPEDQTQRIFEAYQRAHNAPGLPGSIGLGLAVSLRLARVMGGDLTYAQVDGLCVFELSLPTEAHLAEDGAGSPRPEPATLAS